MEELYRSWPKPHLLRRLVEIVEVWESPSGYRCKKMQSQSRTSRMMCLMSSRLMSTIRLSSIVSGVDGMTDLDSLDDVCYFLGC